MNNYSYKVRKGVLQVYHHETLVAIHNVVGYPRNSIKDLFYMSAFDHSVEVK